MLDENQRGVSFHNRNNISLQGLQSSKQKKKNKKNGFLRDTHIRNYEKEPVLFWHFKGTLQVFS